MFVLCCEWVKFAVQYGLTVFWPSCCLVFVSQVPLSVCSCQASSGNPLTRDKKRRIGEDHSLLRTQSRLHRHQDPPLGPGPLSGHVPWNRQCHEECWRGGGKTLTLSLIRLFIHYAHSSILFCVVSPSSGFRWWRWAGPLRRACKRPWGCVIHQWMASCPGCHSRKPGLILRTCNRSWLCPPAPASSASQRYTNFS